MVIPAGTGSPTIGAIAPATPTTVAATTVSAAAVAGVVDVGGLVRQSSAHSEGVGQRTRSDVDAWALLSASQRARAMTVRCWVKYETGPVMPFASRTDSRRSGSWESTADAAATTWPARSVPKYALPSTPAIQWTLPSRKAPSFEMVDVAAAERATAAAGRAPTA